MKSKLQLVINPHEPDELQMGIFVCEGDIERVNGQNPLPSDKWKLREIVHMAADAFVADWMFKRKMQAPYILIDFEMDKYVFSARGCEEWGYKKGHYLP